MSGFLLLQNRTPTKIKTSESLFQTKNNLLCKSYCLKGSDRHLASGQTFCIQYFMEYPIVS